MEIVVFLIEAFVYNIVIKNYKISFKISLINNIIGWLGAYFVCYF